MEQQHPIPQQISAYQFRLVGDMTIKQFFQVAGGALVALLIYSSGLHPYIKWPLIVVSFLFGIALAFFPLEDRPLSKWIFLFFKAIYSPTVYKWKKLDPKPEYFQAEGATQPISLTPASVAPPTLAASVATTEVRVVPPPPVDEPPAGPQDKTTITMQALDTMLIPEVPKPRVFPSEKEGVATLLEKSQISPEGFEIAPSTGSVAGGATTAQFTPEASPPAPPNKPNLVVGQATDSGGKIIENAILEIKDSEGRAVRGLRSNKLGHFMIVVPLMDGNYQIETEKEGYSFGPVSFEAKGQIIPPISILGNKVESEPPQTDSTSNIVGSVFAQPTPPSVVQVDNQPRGQF